MLRTGKTSALTVSTASFRGAALAKLADLTAKTKLVRDPVAGLRGLLSRLPCRHQPAIIPLRSIVGDSDSLASRSRDCARWQVTLSPSRPGQRHRLRGWLSRTTGEAYGAPASAIVASPCSPVLHTTHIVRSFRSFLAPHIYSFRADTPHS